MPFKPITETMQKLIIDMFDNGNSLYHIAEELMLDRNTVYKYLLREGKVEPDLEVIANGRKRYSQEEIQKVVKMYRSGVPVREINEVTGMSIPSIYNHVRKSGKLRVTPKKNVDKALRLYKAKKHSVQDILDMTDVPRTTLYKEIKERRANGEEI